VLGLAVAYETSKILLSGELMRLVFIVLGCVGDRIAFLVIEQRKHPAGLGSPPNQETRTKATTAPPQ